MPISNLIPQLIILLLPMATAVPTAAQEDRIKVFIIEGVSNHDWRHRVEIAREILAKEVRQNTAILKSCDGMDSGQRDQLLAKTKAHAGKAMEFHKRQGRS